MSTITNSVGKIYYGVNKIYQKSTYLERYGGSVIFSIFAQSYLLRDFKIVSFNFFFQSITEFLYFDLR